MGWAWNVNDLSKYLPDAETLADMTPAEDISVMDPEVPLTDLDLEPQVDPQRETSDPYVIDVLFPHAPPGPAETELMGGDAPALLPRSQDVDLVASAIDIPMPPHLKKALRTWSREDLHVRVFQGVRSGGPKARQVCCRETFDMETGSLLAREYFDPGKGPACLPTPALPDCSPASSRSLSVRGIYSCCCCTVSCSCLCLTQRSPSCGRHPGGGCVSTRPRGTCVRERGSGTYVHPCPRGREADVPENGGVDVSMSAFCPRGTLAKEWGSG